MPYLLLQISILPESKLNDSCTHAVFLLYSELLHTYLFYLTFTKTLSGRDDYYPSDFAKRKVQCTEGKWLIQDDTSDILLSAI